MQKVPGVSTVKVSLNEGLTVLDLKPGNAVTLANLRQIIRNNGFTTNESQVVARGTVTAVNQQLVFEVLGSRERLTLVAAPNAVNVLDDLRARLKATGAADVVLTGIADIKDPKALRLSVTHR